MNSEVVSNSENHRKRRSFQTVTHSKDSRQRRRPVFLNFHFTVMTGPAGQLLLGMGSAPCPRPLGSDGNTSGWTALWTPSIMGLYACNRNSTKGNSVRSFPSLPQIPAVLETQPPGRLCSAPGTEQRASGASSIFPSCRSTCKVNKTHVGSCLHSPCLTWDCKLRGINLIRNNTLQQRKVWANLY